MSYLEAVYYILEAFEVFFEQTHEELLLQEPLQALLQILVHWIKRSQTNP